ncbi:MAG: hypothetical protein II839_07610 [Kiritimatiellae bacterium]|nr:hypothetical protein [Kiritimatiellia bacterium]
MKDALYMAACIAGGIALTLLFWHFFPPVLDFTSLPSEHHPFTETPSHD